MLAFFYSYTVPQNIPAYSTISSCSKKGRRVKHDGLPLTRKQMESI